MEKLNFLALSGSLRQSSYNTAAIKALRVLSPAHITITIGDIGNLPLFNPDMENDTIPALESLTNALQKSDGLIIASPEYAHGISGPMKNALDWLVGGSAFPYKPIMLINTSPRATHAQESLREVLTTMSGTIVGASCISLPLLGSNLNSTNMINNEKISSTLTQGLTDFYLAVSKHHT